MRRDGHFLPDEIMYNSILDGCTKQRNVSEALRLLDEMKASGIKPSNYTLSILVKLQLGSARDLRFASAVSFSCKGSAFCWAEAGERSAPWPSNADGRGPAQCKRESVLIPFGKSPGSQLSERAEAQHPGLHLPDPCLLPKQAILDLSLDLIALTQSAGASRGP